MLVEAEKSYSLLNTSEKPRKAGGEVQMPGSQRS